MCTPNVFESNYCAVYKMQIALWRNKQKLRQTEERGNKIRFVIIIIYVPCMFVNSKHLAQFRSHGFWKFRYWRSAVCLIRVKEHRKCYAKCQYLLAHKKKRKILKTENKHGYYYSYFNVIKCNVFVSRDTKNSLWKSKSTISKWNLNMVQMKNTQQAISS